MTAVHLVERKDNVRKTDKTKNEWESGYWPLPEETAKKLVGGTLYLHRGKQQPSHFGGRILSYSIKQSGPHAGLLLVRLREPGASALVSRVHALAQERGLDSFARCFVVLTDRKLRVRRS